MEVIYDGTNMQLVNQLGNAGGGTPGGSSTHIQFNNSGAFGGDAGLTWDNTNKAVFASRNNSAGWGGTYTAFNSGSYAVGGGSYYRACQNNDFNDCAYIQSTYGNYDGGGSAVWSRFISVFGGSYLNVISGKPTAGQVDIGGSDTSAGWLTLTNSAATRFANASTAGRGLVSIQGAPSELTGQTGNVAAQTLLASSHTAGMYRVCGFVAVTAAGTGSTAAWTLSWRSPASGTDLTHNLLWSSGGAETATFSVASADEFNVCKVIRSTGTSAISLDPGDMNTATYTTAWTVERLR